MPVEVRPITDDEAGDFIRTLQTPFAFDIDDDPEGRVERFWRLHEMDRARAAFDGRRMVGTLGCFSLDMTVPGGSVPCAGTTVVAVSPTHRRQGVLRELMEAHFADARQRRDPIAALFASDSAIYGRFGYGQASLCADIEIDREHVEFHRLSPDPAPVRTIDPADAKEVLPQVFDRMRVRRPGMFARSDTWWELERFRDERPDREGQTAYRYAVADGPDGVEGYVQYRSRRGRWEGLHGDNKVKVRELIALTPAAAAGLWSLVLSHDLTVSVSADAIPVDDPLFDLLAGPRRAAPRVLDQLWVRLLDVPAALEARVYTGAGSLVLSAGDPVSGEVGTFRLTVGGDGSVSCTPTAEEPDLELDLEDLGACYLGRARFRQLATSGRVRGEASMLAQADALFTWDPTPWCQEVF